MIHWPSYPTHLSRPLSELHSLQFRVSDSRLKISRVLCATGKDGGSAGMAIEVGGWHQSTQACIVTHPYARAWTYVHGHLLCLAIILLSTPLIDTSRRHTLSVPFTDFIPNTCLPTKYLIHTALFKKLDRIIQNIIVQKPQWDEDIQNYSYGITRPQNSP